MQRFLRIDNKAVYITNPNAHGVTRRHGETKNSRKNLKGLRERIVIRTRNCYLYSKLKPST